jgi:uncharacterized protein YraI
MNSINYHISGRNRPEGNLARMAKRQGSTAMLSLLIIIIAILASVKVVWAEPVWDAKYWNNTDLSGDPVLHRGESDLNHDWGQGSPPDVNSDQFSARWKRTIDVSAGTYRFTATMDDGMRVWVDGDLVIDGWYPSQVHSLSADVYLSEGDHEVLVKYFQDGGNAVAKLERTRISDGTTTGGNWRGEYYANNYLGGSTVMVRNDAAINFVWGTGSPASNVVPSDQFSVRWTQNVSFNAGRYRFIATADDGVRLWVNNALVIDQWTSASATSHTVEVDLPGGTLPVKMEYFENYGDATAQLSWLQISGTPTPTTITAWRGEYYSNKFLTGSSVLVRNDTDINFDWGNGSPQSNLPSDGFSVRWTRDLAFDAGRYRFTAITDDGVRLWVNNQLIIDQWTDHASQSFHGEINLPGGAVPIKMEYYDGQGQAIARLNWTKVDSTTPAASSGQAVASVTAGRLNVRQGPGLGYSIITVTTYNTNVTLTHRNADASWVRVILPDGVQGWVSSRYLASSQKPFTWLPLWEESAPVTSTTPPAAANLPTAWVINCTYLNVRQGPGVSYGVITHIGYRQIVQLAGYRNANTTWVKIVLADGTQGWVNAYYLGSSYSFFNLTVGG